MITHLASLDKYYVLLKQRIKCDHYGDSEKVKKSSGGMNDAKRLVEDESSPTEPS